MSVRPTSPHDTVADYDSNDYDYQTFWTGRDYEQWAETVVLTRLMRELGPSEWFADFGGGFGRNAVHYRDWVAHAVLIDYSVTNLVRAGELYAEDVAAGRLHLVRADLAALPFVDSAFDASMTVRVLHHLADIERAVDEMLRTVRRRALVRRADQASPARSRASRRLEDEAHRDRGPRAHPGWPDGREVLDLPARRDPLDDEPFRLRHEGSGQRQQLPALGSAHSPVGRQAAHPADAGSGAGGAAHRPRMVGP